MKVNYKKIKEDLGQFRVPDYDHDKMQETISLSKAAYCKQQAAERIEFWQFLYMQVRFISKWVWLTQAILLLISLLLLNRYRLGVHEMQPVFLLFSSVAPMIAFVGFPEMLKSYSHNMEEIEACTRFPMRRLIGARMLILGLTDLCSLTVILAASAVSHGTLILRMILYMFVPFNLTCSGCLTVIDHIKSKNDGYFCAAVCFLGIIIFCKLSFFKEFYEPAAMGIWVIMFIISVVYLVIEIIRTFRSIDSFYSSKEETLSVTW